MLPPLADVFNPSLLAGRTALITGGSSGIGFEMARGLGAVGCRVVIAARTADRIETAVAALRDSGVTASGTQLDVRDPDAVERVVNEVAAETGGIDILINNAGGTFAKKAEELSANGWRAVIDLNLNGTSTAAYKVPKQVVVVTALPKTGLGKIAKHELRAELAAQL